MRHGYIVLMRWMMIYEYGVPGGAFLTTQTMATIGVLPYQGNIPMVEPGIKPRTS
jgi:hypothetical protein